MGGQVANSKRATDLVGGLAARDSVTSAAIEHDRFQFDLSKYALYSKLDANTIALAAVHDSVHGQFIDRPMLQQDSQGWLLDPEVFANGIERLPSSYEHSSRPFGSNTLQVPPHEDSADTMLRLSLGRRKDCAQRLAMPDA